MELLEKSKSLKIHVLKQDEVTDSQGSAQHRHKALLTKAKGATHSGPLPENSLIFTDSEKISCKTECIVCCYLNNDGNNSVSIEVEENNQKVIPQTLNSEVFSGSGVKKDFHFY